MKVSLNTIKQFIGFELPPIDELVGRINQQLGGVEEVINLGAKYQDAVIVKVVECEKHTNADKLSVCKIDAGRGELIQVVCGAPNVRADMWAVWLPPESIVPSTFDDNEPFKLGARELRGVMSQGMLAASDELAIGSDHDGIVEISDADLPSGKSLSAGDSFAATFGLDDTIIDIENKMFTHRPDCFGQLGVAREIAGILGYKFTSPDWYLSAPEFVEATGLELEVFNDAPDKVSRFMAVAMQGVTVGPSPLWLQCVLVAMGSKPINNIVDVTNYIMLITAQPTHAYDYDKLRDHKLGARMARDGETIKLLNGKTYQLTSDDIVIADGQGPVGLGGIMGGGESEVSPETKNIVLECATFDMYTARKSAMCHGVFTDALTRFNKGQSSLQNDRVLSRLMELMSDMAGGQLASRVFDFASHQNQSPVATTDQFINQRLGLELSASDVGSLLGNVEVAVETDDAGLRITAPFWRTDIELPEDIVEEVGRLYGFDNLPLELPKKSLKPAAKNQRRDLEEKIRTTLSRAGANEVLLYSFVHEKVLTKAGQNAEQAFRLSNALSPDLQYYRLSLTPSLVDKVHTNIKAGHDEFALFEIGKAHNRSSFSQEDGLPAELPRVGLTYAAKDSKVGAPYYRAKRILDYLAESLGLSLVFKPLPAESKLTLSQPFEQNRRVRVIDEKSGRSIGIIGEYSQSVRKKFKLPVYSAGFELLTEGIEIALKTASLDYRPISRFPSVERDICFQVPLDVSYGDIIGCVNTELYQLDVQSRVSPVDIYQPDGAQTKNVTIRIRMTSETKTLTSEDVSCYIDSIATKVIERTAATVV